MKLFITLFLSLLVTTAKAQPATHGMFLFGEQNLYASHLPMFHAPHDFQVILKVHLEDVMKLAVTEKFFEAKAEGDKFFTLAPEPMELSDIINGEKTEFLAKLFNGHFEKGGEFMGTVSVIIEKVLLSKKLVASAQPSTDYFLFGQDGEYFAAHIIGGAPSFDMIASIQKPQKAFCKQEVCGFLKDFELPLQITTGNANIPSKESVLISSKASTAILDILYMEKDELSH